MKIKPFTRGNWWWEAQLGPLVFYWPIQGSGKTPAIKYDPYWRW